MRHFGVLGFMRRPSSRLPREYEKSSPFADRFLGSVYRASSLGLERCRVSDGGQLLLLDDSYACHGLHSAPT